MAISTSLKISFNGNEVKRGLSSMKSDFGKAAKSAAKIGLAVGAIGAALIFAAKKAIDFGLAINKMGEAGNTANARVEQMIKNTEHFGDASEKVAERITDLANVTARKVGIDQKMIKEAQASVIAFRSIAATADEAGGAFDRVIQTAIDMGGNVQSNALRIAKAMEDPERGMTRLINSGVKFTDAQREMVIEMSKTGNVSKAQGIILDALEKRYGGVAAATANASDQIAVGMQQVKESFAMGFADAFSGVPGQIDGVISAMIEKVAPVGKRLGEIISDGLKGDTGDLYEAAALIGITIGETIKAGTMYGMRGLGGGMVKFLEDINPIRKATDKAGLNEGIFARGSEKIISSTNELIKRDIDEIIWQAQQSIQNLMQNRNGENQQRNRLRKELPQGSIQNTGGILDPRFLQVLERIEKNTQEGAKF